MYALYPRFIPATLVTATYVYMYVLYSMYIPTPTPLYSISAPSPYLGTYLPTPPLLPPCVPRLLPPPPSIPSMWVWRERERERERAPRAGVARLHSQAGQTRYILLYLLLTARCTGRVLTYPPDRAISPAGRN